MTADEITPKLRLLWRLVLLLLLVLVLQVQQLRSGG